MDDLALDRELETAADDCLARFDGDKDAAANLLLRWIESGSIGAGIRERILNDYVRALIYDRATVREDRRSLR